MTDKTEELRQRAWTFFDNLDGPLRAAFERLDDNDKSEAVDQLEDALSTIPEGPSMTQVSNLPEDLVESGWLIEEDGGWGVTHWIALVENIWERGWYISDLDNPSPVRRVKDSNEALRFSRQQDAEAFISLFKRFLLCPKATGHEWHGPASTIPAQDALVDAIADISAERKRQVEAEGWTPEHDDTHAEGGYDNGPILPQAAACYALGSPVRWPWDEEWWKPSDHRRNCVKAAALLVAEIERLDRAKLPAPPVVVEGS